MVFGVVDSGIVYKENGGETYLSSRRLYLNSDKTRVVEDGEPDASHLLVCKNGSLEVSTAKRFNLTEEFLLLTVEELVKIKELEAKACALESSKKRIKSVGNGNSPITTVKDVITENAVTTTDSNIPTVK